MEAGPKQANDVVTQSQGGSNPVPQSIGNGQQGQPQSNSDAGSEMGPVEEGMLLTRVHVPELFVSKCLQFPKDQLVWDVKQQCLASLPKVRELASTLLVTIQSCSVLILLI